MWLTKKCHHKSNKWTQIYGKEKVIALKYWEEWLQPGLGVVLAPWMGSSLVLRSIHKAPKHVGVWSSQQINNGSQWLYKLLQPKLKPQMCIRIPNVKWWTPNAKWWTPSQRDCALFIVLSGQDEEVNEDKEYPKQLDLASKSTKEGSSWDTSRVLEKSREISQKLGKSWLAHVVS